MKALYLITATILLVVAALFINEGFAYVTHGYGLHPTLATVAFLVAMAGYAMVLDLFADWNEAPRLD